MRVAVLGHGSIGRRHAAILRQLGCEVAVFDPALEEGSGSEEAVVAGAEAAVIASPSSEHERQALLALDADVPVLVEKPLALDAAGALAVAARCRQRAGTVEVAMNLRHHPGVLGVRALMAQAGRVARASAWCGSWLPGWRPDTDYRTAYSSRRSLGGGVLLDAINEIDYMLWLLGPARRAAGMTGHVSSLEMDVEDVAMVHIEHESGALSSITLDYLDRPYHRGCRVVGEDASVDWEWTRGTVRLDRGEGPALEREAPADVAATYEAQMRRFLSVVRGESAPLVGAEGAVAALEVLDAVRRDEVALRPAHLQDRDRLLQWRNDPTVRAASRGTREISLAEHAAWFAARLADADSRLFIVEHRGEPVGQVRVDRRTSGEGEIHVALAASARGRGLATPALRAAARQAARELSLHTLIAEVRETNISSLRAFARAGFIVRSHTEGWVRLQWSTPQPAGPRESG